MGLSAAVFALIIAITGLLLNHTEDFAFDSRHVQSEWVLDWYGIEAPQDIVSYPAGDRHVTLIEDSLYLNRIEIDGSYHTLHGATDLGGIFVIAVDNTALLVTPLGEIIERLQGGSGAPSDITRLGIAPGGALIAEAGSGYYRVDNNFIQWDAWEGDPSGVRWALPGPLEPQFKASLQRQFRNRILPWERVLLDLHSGRFFGRLGPWIFDAAALLLILLALSGTLIWLKRKR